MFAAVLLLTAVLHGNAWRVERPARLAAAHSHNDYEQQHPLADALAARFPSVEADVWWREGGIVVSHDESRSRGSLEELYLAPLQARVDRLGSVYGDGRTFYLWIDLKDSSLELTEALHELLERYPMLTVYSDDAVVPGPVVAILTGDEAAKARFTDTHHVRRACRDSNEMNARDGFADRRFTWYALDWREFIGWWDRRHGVAELRCRLRALADRAHAMGRRLRLYRVPEEAGVWEAAIASGVDLVSTDRISAFRAFVDAAPATGGAGDRLARSDD